MLECMNTNLQVDNVLYVLLKLLHAKQIVSQSIRNASHFALLDTFPEYAVDKGTQRLKIVPLVSARMALLMISASLSIPAPRCLGSELIFSDFPAKVALLKRYGILN